MMLDMPTKLLEVIQDAIEFYTRQIREGKAEGREVSDLERNLAGLEARKMELMAERPEGSHGPS
jgi:hypothetical protein